jgi:hypothetical protein
MPLVSGSSPGAFKQNVRTLMGEIGKSPHVQSREQALAIAYAKQRLLVWLITTTILIFRPSVTTPNLSP